MYIEIKIPHRALPNSTAVLPALYRDKRIVVFFLCAQFARAVLTEKVIDNSLTGEYPPASYLQNRCKP